MPSELHEHEIYSALIDAIGKAEGCLVQMAYHRSDPRWSHVAARMHEMGLLIKTLATSRLTVN